MVHLLSLNLNGSDLIIESIFFIYILVSLTYHRFKKIMTPIYYKKNTTAEVKEGHLATYILLCIICR